MLDQVLLLSASVGAGHVRAAQALERAFRDAGAAREVRHVDVLEHTNALFRRLYSRVYLELVNNAPEVLGWLYEYLDSPWKHERRRLAFDKLNTRPFVRLLETYRPQWTVCTHFLPAEIISWLRGQGRLEARHAVVVTDFDVHAMWLHRQVDRYFVALDETREHLRALGFPGDRITVSGIPIDPVFAAPKESRAMRERHGLEPERPTILVSAGGFGVGPVERLVEALRGLRHPAQVVVICGRSAELKLRLDRLAAGAPPGGPVALHVVGYTTEMDEYMAAADLLVGKPGGLTTSEARARGLPLVIVNPIPGQEERNADHLLEEGAAIRCNNLPVLAYKIDRLLDDPGRLDALRRGARRRRAPRRRPTSSPGLIRDLPPTPPSQSRTAARRLTPPASHR
jgi:processive 1,2-diacylglycerol beta-glucosyltransferase